MKNSFARTLCSSLFFVGLLSFSGDAGLLCPSASAQEKTAIPSASTASISMSSAAPLPAKSLPSDGVQFLTATIGDNRWMQLPSELPSGDAMNDKIWFQWYPARGLVSQRGPAVILVHPLGRHDQSPMHKYARYLSANGVACAVLMLPYHGRRLPARESGIRRFVNSDTQQVVRTFKQSASDIGTVLTWMSTQPTVDSERLGAVGVSIGAILVHLVMGQDTRIKAAVASLGGGDLAETYRRSPFAQWKIVLRLFGVSDDHDKIAEEDLARLAEVDPLTYADRNQPRRVLMIQAARDVVVPPRSAEVLWEKLGRPPIQWIDANHFAAIDLAADSTAQASLAYLKSVWSGAPLAPQAIPKVRVATVKAGLVMNLDSVVTPAVQWQFYGLGKRRHSPILSANLGMSGRGPFVGVAATVTPYLDIGAARRFKGNRIRPYASLHFVY